MRILQRVICWDMVEQIPARRSPGMIFAWIAVAVMLVFWLALGSLLSAMLSGVTSSGAYHEALSLARASTEVQSHLGPDFTSRFPALGFVSSRYNSQSANSLSRSPPPTAQAIFTLSQIPFMTPAHSR